MYATSLPGLCQVSYGTVGTWQHITSVAQELSSIDLPSACTTFLLKRAYGSIIFQSHPLPQTHRLAQMLDTQIGQDLGAQIGLDLGAQIILDLGA